MATCSVEGVGMSSVAESKGASGGMGLLLIVLIGVALAAAAGGDELSIEDGAGAAGSAAISNPCPPDKDPDHVVQRFLGKYKLRCGHGGFGYNHIARRHGPISRDTMTCIQKVLAHVGGKLDEGNLVWEWAFEGGDYARVVVNPKTNNIVTAYTKGSGRASARWAQCAKA